MHEFNDAKRSSLSAEGKMTIDDSDNDLLWLFNENFLLHCELFRFPIPALFITAPFRTI